MLRSLTDLRILLRGIAMLCADTRVYKLVS